jgi:hypothetical protein
MACGVMLSLGIEVGDVGGEYALVSAVDDRDSARRRRARAFLGAPRRACE